MIAPVFAFITIIAPVFPLNNFDIYSSSLISIFSVIFFLAGMTFFKTFTSLLYADTSVILTPGVPSRTLL